METDFDTEGSIPWFSFMCGDEELLLEVDPETLAVTVTHYYGRVLIVYHWRPEDSAHQLVFAWWVAAQTAQSLNCPHTPASAIRRAANDDQQAHGLTLLAV